MAAQQRAEIEWQLDESKMRSLEAQQRAEKLEKERQVENFMFLRMIKMLIKTNRLLEDSRAALVAHKTFSLEESFKLFDVNENGRITAQELTQVFTEQGV